MNLEEEAKKHYPKSKEYCDAYREYVVTLLMAPGIDMDDIDHLSEVATALADKEWELRGQ
jgi:hypothetical protein